MNQAILVKKLGNKVIYESLGAHVINILLDNVYIQTRSLGFIGNPCHKNSLFVSGKKDYIPNSNFRVLDRQLITFHEPCKKDKNNISTV